MKKIKTTRLHENQITNRLYKNDYLFDELFISIEKEGILEPLIIQPCIDEDNQYEVVSGNRRLRIARQLKIKEVPVVIQDHKELTKDLIISHQQYRKKLPSEILMEIKSIYKTYGIRQGVRSDLNPKVKKGKELKNQLINQYNKSKIDKLIKIDKYITILEKEDPKIRKRELKNLDNKGSIDGTRKRLKKMVEDLENRKQIPKTYQILREDIKVFHKSSEVLPEIKDNSVATIITSPPYYDLRDYNLGEGELGHELSPDDFVKRLADHFDDSKRVLRTDGTMWVNIGDYVKEFKYSAVPEKFLIKMISKGWKLHDKIIWVKNNPHCSNSNRSVMANEFIYVFKKNNFVNYDTTWIKDYQKELGFISYGNKKFKSVFNFRDNIVISNISENYNLREECKKKGVNLTHDATFPISIPSIAIMTSSKPGDLIVDPFNGTGTTGKSAKLLGRRYIGYDLNPTYIKQTEIRLDMPIETDLNNAA